MFGKTARGTRSRSSSSSSQSSVRRFISIVRDALETSVACTRPPVSCQMSHASMVPAANSPRSARARACGTWSRIQANLDALKYGSKTSPVRCCTRSPFPSVASRCIASAVRRSCHTSAWWIGTPLRRSHTTTVSRWLVMPIAAMSRASAPLDCSAVRAVDSCRAQISCASCSTQPGFGNSVDSSSCARARISPAASTSTLRQLLVP